MRIRYDNVLDDGYALHEALLDRDGEPYDYRFLEANTAFMRLMGVQREQVIGKTLLEVFPDVEPHWLGILRNTAVTGEPAYLEEYAQSVDRYLRVTTSCPNGGLIAAFFTDTTERKQMEEALRKSESRLVDAQRIAHIGSWELDLINNVLVWSDEIYRIFEIDPTRCRASYDVFLKTIHPEDRAAVDLAYRNSVKTRTPYSIDHRLLFPDGRVKFVHEQCETFYDDGAPVRSVGTVQDITERKLAERVLVESEKRFQMQFKAFPLPTYTWQNRDGEFFLLEYNHAAGEASGGWIYNKLGRTAREIYPEHPDITDIMRRCLAHGMPRRIEGKFRTHGSDEERDLVVTYVALPPDIVMTHVEDVTDERRAEAQLRQAGIVFESSLEAVIITDREKNIVAVNKAFIDTTGHAAKEALGTSACFCTGQNDSAFCDDIWAAVDNLGHWQGESYRRRKNGEVFSTWENISVVKDKSGRVVNYVVVFSDISVIKTHEERMTHLAHHDALTGLPNRLLFVANLDLAIEVARRHRSSLAVMFIDLDRFKLVNDTLGHAVGDRLLQLVAERLKRCVRAEDTVARLGGDEFTVIVSELAQTADVAMLAEKLLLAFEKPLFVDAHELTVNLSIGISIFPDDGDDSNGLTKAADAALYRAKERGRNTYEFYTPELTARALEHLALEQALRTALARDEFVVYYQPEIDLSTGEVARLEALLRWKHPHLGLLGPERFMAVAEDSGLITPIGEWVLRSACKQAVLWREKGLSGRIAINLSGRQIVRWALVEKFEEILRETGAASAGVEVELEITESVLHRVEESRSILAGLKSLGVRLAIDDFGIGYSSLAHLRDLPIDTLKIDRSFLRDVPRNPDAASIIEAIVGLGHGLRLTVVGEGVETSAQEDLLRSAHCDRAQGYLYSRAVPVEAIEELLAGARRRMQ